MNYPNNKQFAFTILDDTDSANLENVEPVYRYLKDCGFRTTKTVWPLAYDDQKNSKYIDSSTLADPGYVEFIKWLIDERFEVTWHGPTMESSTRNQVLKGLDFFNETLGFYPSVHINHAQNKDNLYWGLSRFNNKIIKTILGFAGYRENQFSGHFEGSNYYWGDIAKKRFKYCRGFTFNDLNTLNINPTLPYHDPKRPVIDYWFSTTSVDSFIEFEQQFTPKRIAKLIDEKGICIMSTHLGKGFSKDGKIRDSVKKIFDSIAEKNGWFVPVSELLEWQLKKNNRQTISNKEKTTMEWRWIREKLTTKYFKPANPAQWWEL